MWEGERVKENPSTVLKLSGYRAVIEPDRWVPGAYTWTVRPSRT